MLITHWHNTYNYKFTNWERDRFEETQKVYVLILHTSDSKFTNDMNFWTFSFTLVLFCFVLVRLSVSNFVIVLTLLLRVCLVDCNKYCNVIVIFIV